MNKKELIDKAVEDLHGKLDGISNHELDGYTLLRRGEKGYSLAHVDSYAAEEILYFCTKEEFNQRARELGWVNGYKWGVEYPTNGKKPDLPGDVVVDVRYMGALVKTRRRLVGDWGWTDPSVTAFIIVDQRYKPVKVEQVQVDWYDYDKQQAIGLPPVGVECEYHNKISGNYDKAFIVAKHYFDDAVIWSSNKDSGELYYGYKNDFRPLDYNRKADEERRKFVENALYIIDSSPSSHVRGYTVGLLYDAGCRFTETKAASTTRFEYSKERPDQQHVARFTLMPDQYAELTIKSKAAS